MRSGIAAEFADEATLLAAIHRVHDHGLTRLETYGPVPSEAIDLALGKERSSLPLGGIPLRARPLLQCSRYR